jgi:type IV secretory pathway VirB2 component (pilin)
VADQAASRTVAHAAGNTGERGLDVQTGLSHIRESHHGRPASWVAVSIIVVGFVIGGIALVVGPTWWLFWVGTGIVVIGTLFAASIRIFDDWY